MCHEHCISCHRNRCSQPPAGLSRTAGCCRDRDDYDEDAHFYSEAKIYRGKHEIHGFFTDFIAALPAGAIDRFTLTSLRVAGNVAYITWSVGDDIPLGTDTFVVNNGKIVSQTFAMYAVPAQ